MLTIRSFRNEDPPRLVELLRKYHYANTKSPLPPISLDQFQSQVLGLPLLDLHGILLAFDNDSLVGYVHTGFAPTNDGYQLGNVTGNICFLCVDPDYQNAPEAISMLIAAGENYLLQSGVQEIFGGSPAPSLPFYTGFYGGGEPIAFLRSDEPIIRGFLNAGYTIHQPTTWFRLELRQYKQPILSGALQWMTQITIGLNENPKAKSWWEACILASGFWLEATAYLNKTMQPIARVRTRIACPDAADAFLLYSGQWTAALIDIRVHPDYRHRGIGTFLLGELIMQLVARRQITCLDAHVAEGTIALYSLLGAHNWKQMDSGYIFYKPF